MARFSEIHEIDYENQCVKAGPGVTNLSITQAVSQKGFYYAPDPSSRIACTIGGNVAENSGGMHCLKYGLTTNNILGLEMVLLTGEVIKLGDNDFTEGGLDLMGLVTGSEGMLGVVTDVTVRILPTPPQALTMLVGFASVEAAGRTVAGIMARGLIPGAMEMMDRLAVKAAEGFVASGYPLDAAAVLIIELDGIAEEIGSAKALVCKVGQEEGATYIKASESDEERLSMWQGRMSAFPAVGRLSPDYYCMDGTIPRAKLPEVLTAISEMSKGFGLAVANVFHAGDGNLHPLILYDANKPGEMETAEAFGDEILKLCVKVGGVLTGEHGVGIEKRDLMPEMFNEVDLNVQQRVKCAFDPEGLLNPGKVFPTLHRCAELGRVHVHSKVGARFPNLPRY
jgi:glycolate dehydrogenase FAD-linked subunit